MTLLDQVAELLIVNPTCPNPLFPSYDHVLINGKLYTLKGEVVHPESTSIEPYYKFKVILSGILKKEKGHMPNPMCEINTIEITDIKFI